MPAYRYRAVHSTGRVTRGMATAGNEIELAQYLRQSHLELIEAREKKNTPSRESSFFARRPAGVGERALAVFCAQTADLLAAGVPFLDATRDIAATMPGGSMRDVLQDVARALSHGSRISQAFARHPRVFSPVFIAVLASGEASGDMAECFSQLARYVEGRARMNEKLRKALRYPVFLLAVALAVVTFMMVLVVPQIIGFLNTIDSQLPPATRILIACSDLFSRIWWILALAGLTAPLFVLLLRQASHDAALWLDGCLLRLPGVGAVMRKAVLARFSQCFSLLVQSGLKVPESLQGARNTFGNRALEAQLDRVLEKVVSGTPLSAALELLFPPFALRVVRIGEQSGRLGKSLGEVAAHYEREAADSADAMIGMLEPGLTLLIGLIMAWVVMAVLGPIYGSLSHMNVMG